MGLYARTGCAPPLAWARHGFLLRCGNLETNPLFSPGLRAYHKDFAPLALMAGGAFLAPEPFRFALIETNWLLIFPSASHSFVFALPAHKGLAFKCGITELGQPRQAHWVSASRTNNFIVNAVVKNEGVALYLSWHALKLPCLSSHNSRNESEPKTPLSAISTSVRRMRPLQPSV
jgi:hypothetical protein